MKTIAIITLAALALGSSCVCADEKADSKTESKSTSSVSVTSNSKDGKGRAVVVIDVNGKKETREIELPAGGGSNVVVTTDQQGTGKVPVLSQVPLLGGLFTTNANAAHDTGPVTYLGLSPTGVSEALAEQLSLGKGTGLLIESVMPDSPAAQAGLQRNDVLTHLDDQILVNPEQLVTLVRTKKPGDEVKLTFLHKGQQTTATAKLASRDWKDADPTTSPSIEIGDGKVRLNQFLYSLGKSGAPVAIQNRLMVVGPDGKVIVSDATKTLETVAQELEDTLKNRVGPEIMDSVKKALEQARQAIDDGAKKAEDPAPKK